MQSSPPFDRRRVADAVARVRAADAHSKSAAAGDISAFADLMSYGITELVTMTTDSSEHASVDKVLVHIANREFPMAFDALGPLLRSHHFETIESSLGIAACLLVRLEPVLTDAAKFRLMRSVLPHLDADETSTRARVFGVLERLRFPTTRPLLEDLARTGRADDRPRAINTIVEGGLLTNDEATDVAGVFHHFLDKHYDLKQVIEASLRRLHKTVPPCGLAGLAGDTQRFADFCEGLGHAEPALTELTLAALHLDNAEFLEAISTGEPLSPRWDTELSVLEDHITQSETAGTLQPPHLYVHDTLVEIMEERGIARSSLAWLVVTTNSSLDDRTAQTIGHLGVPKALNALEALQQHAWALDVINTASGAIARLANRRRRAQNTLSSGRAAWSYPAQQAFGRLTAAFLSNPEHAQIVACALQLPASVFDTARIAPDPEAKVGDLLLTAMDACTEVRSAFATFARDTTGQHLLDTQTLASTTESGTFGAVLNALDLEVINLRPSAETRVVSAGNWALASEANGEPSSARPRLNNQAHTG